MDTDPCAPPAPVEELLQSALTSYASVGNLDDDPEAWSRLYSLAKRGAEALQAVTPFAGSHMASERAYAALALSRIAETHRELAEPIFAIVSAMLPTETETDVVGAIANALGFIATPSSLDLLLMLFDHPSEDVRFQVAAGIPGYGAWRCEPAYVQVLLELMHDMDDDVRDWATFGVGSLWDIDTPAVREALFARTHDPHAETRSEAILGLARRLDPRALPALVAVLKSANVSCNDIEAAIILADPQLVPALLHVLDVMLDDDWHPRWELELDEAIARCAWSERLANGWFAETS